MKNKFLLISGALFSMYAIYYTQAFIYLSKRKHVTGA